MCECEPLHCLKIGILAQQTDAQTDMTKSAPIDHDDPTLWNNHGWICGSPDNKMLRRLNGLVLKLCRLAEKHITYPPTLLPSQKSVRLNTLECCSSPSTSHLRRWTLAISCQNRHQVPSQRHHGSCKSWTGYQVRLRPDRCSVSPPGRWAISAITVATWAKRRRGLASWAL